MDDSKPAGRTDARDRAQREAILRAYPDPATPARPMYLDEDAAWAAEMRASGKMLKEIAIDMNIPFGTAFWLIRRHRRRNR